MADKDEDEAEDERPRMPMMFGPNGMPFMPPRPAKKRSKPLSPIVTVMAAIILAAGMMALTGTGGKIDSVISLGAVLGVVALMFLVLSER